MEKYLMSSPRTHFDYEISNLELTLDDYDQIAMSDVIHQEYEYDQYGHLGPGQLHPPPMGLGQYYPPDNVPKARGLLSDNTGLVTSIQDLSKIVESNSMDSIPQLSSSVSNQSLASPSSSIRTAAITAPLMTPRKPARNKSLSIGSYNLQTPMRSQTSPNSSVAKISKTPFRHSRSLSRTKIDTKSLNPFYTPTSFISPKYDSLSFDNDDFQTPLQSMAPHIPQHTVPQFMLPYTSPEVHTYRGIEADTKTMSRSMTQPDLTLPSTLGSIKIEDQEDDALKQLKRAKSYSNMAINGSNNLPAPPPDSLTVIASRGMSTDSNPESLEAVASRGVNSSNIQLLQSQFSGLKSYSASINLASIANNKLLPGMTSFPASNLYELPIPGQNGTSSSASSSIPISPSLIKKKKRDSSPEFIPDLPIKINEKTLDLLDPKKKHACPLCLARFQRPEHVKRHMKSHSSEKPFECDQPNCNKRFNRKDNLKAHLKKIHSKIT